MTLLTVLFGIWAFLMLAFAGVGWISKEDSQVHIKGRKLQSDKELQGDLGDD